MTQMTPMVNNWFVSQPAECDQALVLSYVCVGRVTPIKSWPEGPPRRLIQSKLSCSHRSCECEFTVQGRSWQRCWLQQLLPSLRHSRKIRQARVRSDCQQNWSKETFSSLTRLTSL